MHAVDGAVELFFDRNRVVAEPVVGRVRDDAVYGRAVDAVVVYERTSGFEAIAFLIDAFVNWSG